MVMLWLASTAETGWIVSRDNMVKEQRRMIGEQRALITDIASQLEQFETVKISLAASHVSVCVE
jgi:5'(3')-deoxyribonucleotidase